MPIIDLTKKADGITKEFLEKNFTSDEKIYISHGWIDSHVHIFDKAIYTTNHKVVNELKGITTLIDAGSAGIKTLPEFDESMKDIKSKTFSLLNVNENGLKKKNELKGVTLDLNSFKEGLEAKNVIGAKVRLSNQAMDGDTDSFKKVIQKIKDIKYPIMYHVGNMDIPTWDFLRNNIREGDVITHFYHNKNDFVYQAIKNGCLKNVVRDVGWGSESFSFDAYDKFKVLGMKPDIISTDMHDSNVSIKTNSLNYFMSYFLNNGMSIEEVINAVTVNPHKFLLKEKHGDYLNSFTFFKIVNEKVTLHDSVGKEKVIERLIVPVGTKTKEGIKLC